MAGGPWRYRAGDVAEYRGRTYRALGVATGSGTAGELVLTLAGEDGPPPEGLRRFPAEPGCYLVDPALLRAWYSSRWTFRWRGEPFGAIAAGEDRISGWYAGSNVSFASAHLHRVGAIEYEGTFPLPEVTDLTEHRTDLLSTWRGRQGR